VIPEALMPSLAAAIAGIDTRPQPRLKPMILPNFGASLGFNANLFAASACAPPAKRC
jgi:hypothetical protein